MCFGQFPCPSSGVSQCTHSNGISHSGLLTACKQDQDGTSSILILLTRCRPTAMTYTIALCTVKNSWWWTEKLSETCRVSVRNKIEKLVHLVGFIIRNRSLILPIVLYGYQPCLSLREEYIRRVFGYAALSWYFGWLFGQSVGQILQCSWLIFGRSWFKPYPVYIYKYFPAIFT
jgi:hypothetical protein